jgi:hypothetical protein
MAIRGGGFSPPPSFVGKHEGDIDYLSVTAVLKDEAPYLREWIEFHLMLGVQRFYLYDNASSDHPERVLKPYIDQGLVRLFTTNMQACQLACYYNACRVFGNRTLWMAFIDIDEFLFPVQGNDLKILLKDYESQRGLVVGWVLYGTSYLKERPWGLQIENFYQCAEAANPDSRCFKSIVKPQEVLVPGTPHNFLFLEGFNVDENFQKVTELFGERTFNRIRINHYVTRSRREWEDKVARGNATVTDDNPRNMRTEENFRQFDRNEVLDPCLHRFVPEMLKRLDLKDHLFVGEHFKPETAEEIFRVKNQTRHWKTMMDLPQDLALSESIALSWGPERLDTLRFSMTKNEVLEKWGEPDKEFMDPELGLQVLSYHGGASSLFFEAGTEKLKAYDVPAELIVFQQKKLSDCSENEIIFFLREQGFSRVEREFYDDGQKRFSFPEGLFDFYLSRQQKILRLCCCQRHGL